MQVRAICVQIAYHSKLEVSSLSGDFKNAHRSPAIKQIKIQKDPYDSKGYTYTHTHYLYTAHICQQHHMFFKCGRFWYVESSARFLQSWGFKFCERHILVKVCSKTLATITESRPK